MTKYKFAKEIEDFLNVLKDGPERGPGYQRYCLAS